MAGKSAAALSYALNIHESDPDYPICQTSAETFAVSQDQSIIEKKNERMKKKRRKKETIDKMEQRNDHKNVVEKGDVLRWSEKNAQITYTQS